MTTSTASKTTESGMTITATVSSEMLITQTSAITTRSEVAESVTVELSKAGKVLASGVQMAPDRVGNSMLSASVAALVAGVVAQAQDQARSPEIKTMIADRDAKLAANRESGKSIARRDAMMRMAMRG